MDRSNGEFDTKKKSPYFILETFGAFLVPATKGREKLVRAFPVDLDTE